MDHRRFWCFANLVQSKEEIKSFSSWLNVVPIEEHGWPEVLNIDYCHKPYIQQMYRVSINMNWTKPTATFATKEANNNLNVVCVCVF